MNTFLILDTFNFLHRAYHALPKTFTDTEGNPTNAVYGFSSMLVTVLKEFEPTYVVAAFESKDTELIRATQFVDYKAQRPEMESDLKVQIPVVEKVLDAVGVHRVTLEGYEADDVIGCLSKLPLNPEGIYPERAKRVEGPLSTLIVSNDHDMFQLINDHVKVLNPGIGQKQAELYDETAVKARYGFSPKQIVDYKALRGDPSDNIPGVFGIGEKTAKDLIAQFGSLENLYANLDKVVKDSVRQRLSEGSESAIQSKHLATIQCAAPSSFNLEAARLPTDWKSRAIATFTDLHFKSLVARLENNSSSSQTPKRPEVSKGQLELL